MPRKRPATRPTPGRRAAAAGPEVRIAGGRWQRMNPADLGALRASGIRFEERPRSGPPSSAQLAPKGRPAAAPRPRSGPPASAQLAPPAAPAGAPGALPPGAANLAARGLAGAMPRPLPVPPAATRRSGPPSPSQLSASGGSVTPGKRGAVTPGKRGSGVTPGQRR